MFEIIISLFVQKWFVKFQSNIEFNQLFNCEDDSHQTKYFEKPPNTLEVSIKIIDLFKRFDFVTALRGVNLNVYKGEITALLGHNGAGKSTTMAILTGKFVFSSSCPYRLKIQIEIFKSSFTFEKIVY